MVKFPPLRVGKEAVFIAVIALLLALPGTSSAVVRDGRVEDVPGLRFQNIVYSWNNIFIDIVNMTNRNVSFGGTMTFLDRRGYPLAVVNLLPKRIAHNSIERYKAYCVKGSGEAARRAVRVVWDFSPY